MKQGTIVDGLTKKAFHRTLREIRGQMAIFVSINPRVFFMTFLRNKWMGMMHAKDLGLLLIRVVFGVSMLVGHGLTKWAKLWSGQPNQFEAPFGLEPALTLGIAVLAEVGGSILVILGLLTRLALLPLIATMFVALFVVHDGDAFSTMEKALLYGATFLGLFFTGPGKLSLDYLFKRTQI